MMLRSNPSPFPIRWLSLGLLSIASSCAPTPPPAAPPPTPMSAERATKSDDAALSAERAEEPDRPEPSLAPLLDAYRAGVAEALREIKADQMTLSTAGIARATTRDASGLPMNNVETDAIDGQTLIRIMGHNDTVRMWKGLPTNPAP